MEALTPAPEHLTIASRLLHRVEKFTTRTSTSIFVGLGVVVTLIAIVWRGFDNDLQFGFATVCSGVTVVMVFVLQHTQRRSQVATQLKLDELIRAMPQADNRIIHVETSSNDELEDLEHERVRIHAELRQPDEAAT